MLVFIFGPNGNMWGIKCTSGISALDAAWKY